MHHLPSTLRELLVLAHGAAVNADHSLAQVHADLHQHLGVLVVRDRLHNSLCALRRIARLEDTGANKHTITAQLHHQRGIRRRRDTTRRKVDHRQAPQLGRLLEQRVINLQLLGVHAQLHLVHGLRALDLRRHRAHVSHRLDDVARAGFALGADHGCAFGDAAQCLAQPAAAAHKGDLEVVLADVVDGVGGGEDFGFVDVVYAEGFEDLGRLVMGPGEGVVERGRVASSSSLGVWETYLALDKVTDSCLGHDGNGDCLHDLLDHLGVAHACHATLSSDISGDALESHDGRGTGLLCYASLQRSVSKPSATGAQELYLLGVDDIHDYAALQHAGKASLDGEVVLAILGAVAVCGGEFSCHCGCGCECD